MSDFGLGKLRLLSAAAGLLMTQAAGTHPAAFTLNDVMQAPFAWGHGGRAHGRSRGVGIQREGLQ